MTSGVYEGPLSTTANLSELQQIQDVGGDSQIWNQAAFNVTLTFITYI